MTTLAPFIIGAPRSGTTLLRMMLDAHPALAIPPETNFSFLFSPTSSPATAASFCAALTASSNWVDFHLSAADLARIIAPPFTVADGLRRFYELYAARFGKARWGDKTPDYGFHLEAIGQLLPEARFVHIIRDGRDGAVSLRDLWFAPSRDFSALGWHWAERLRTIRRMGLGRADYMEVRYEALIRDPARVLKEICAFIALDWDEAMLRYHERSGARLQEHEGRLNADGSVLLTKSQRLAQQRLVQFPPDATRIGAWRSVMSAEDAKRFTDAAGDVLRDLGYV